MSRLDVWLVTQGAFASRERARRAIETGAVKVNGRLVRKPSFSVGEEDHVEVEPTTILRYVSQGGLKLERAIEAFGIDFREKIVLDIGASTGGFTDCALQHGAAHVYAVDVGTDQLHPSLRKHPQVTVLERQDVRQLQLSQLGGRPADLLTIDVSFISLRPILSYLPPLLQSDGRLMALIKPQFELDGRRFKGGIVRDPAQRLEALRRVVQYGADAGLRCLQTEPTDADGREKNVEYLSWWMRVAGSR